MTAPAVRVLCLNAGSSSLRAAAFAVDAGRPPARVMSHHVERIGDAGVPDHVSAFHEVAGELGPQGFGPVDVVAHRLVHGGPRLLEHVVVDPSVRAELDGAVAFAPLHLTRELAVLDAACERFPQSRQVVCLDTAFHRDLPAVARRLPLPEAEDRAGIRRYGFHGLSYEYLVDRLGDDLGARAVLAHLGNGASLAAVRDGVGCDTTMGLTPTGGLVMGTRTGDLDPGVVVHLLRSSGLDADALERLVDDESGLAGLSGRSGDVRDLLAARDAGDAASALALDVYETVAAKHVAAMTTVLGGIDTLVFAGGVGEHAAPIRAGIAARLAHLGVAIDAAANAEDRQVISAAGSPVMVRVEPTDEESMMARHSARLAGG